VTIKSLWLPYGSPIKEGKNQGKQDGVTAQVVTIVPSSGDQTVIVNAQLDWGAQTEQLTYLAGYLKAYYSNKCKLILAGDLNEVWPGLKAMIPGDYNLDNLLINRVGSLTYFNGADDASKTRQCDHILAQTGTYVAQLVHIDTHVKTISDAIKHYGSDHAPVSAYLSEI
jgi:endonuclease/exonuclease/phosphatase family metal-dependent hydrolase